jgi:integrase
MSVKFRNGEWWIDYRPEGKYGPRLRYPLGPSIKSQEEAEQYERDLKGVRQQKQSHSQSLPTGRTIAELWPYYHDFIETNWEKSTALDVEITGRHISRHIGKVSVLDIGPHVIESYKKIRKKDVVPTHRKEASLRKRVSAASVRTIGNRTINKELAWLSGMLRYCREQLKIEVPYFQFLRLKYERPVPTILSPQEAADLLLAAEPLYRAYFGFLYLMGCRLDEARNVTWESLDSANGRVTVMGKGRKERVLPVPPWLFYALDQIKPPEATGYIFYNKRTKKPIYDIKVPLRRAAKKAGITKRVYPHLLRHSYGAHSLEAEVDIRVLQKLFGHSTLEMTRWYTQVVGGSLKKASDKLMEFSPLSAPTIDITSLSTTDITPEPAIPPRSRVIR